MTGKKLRRKLDIGMGYMGNGTVVWNRARAVGTDYERVAHISENGEIAWRIPRAKLPDSVVEVIEKQARNPKWMHSRKETRPR